MAVVPLSAANGPQADPAALDPSAVSGDYAAMAPFWNMVDAILGGSQTMRDAREAYLPTFPNESKPDYNIRVANAKFTNIYADIVNSLASKPFSEECTLDDEASDKLKKLSEDIDGRGNNLHVFAADVFFHGVNYAIDWILIDHVKAVPNTDGRPLSQEQEDEQGLRPYWVHVPAKRMLAVYTGVVANQEVIVHARMEENVTERVGYQELLYRQVRVFNREPIFQDLPTGGRKIVGYEPATYQLWREADGSWNIQESGKVTIGIIPIVPFVTGRRKGASWQFVPPMQDAAYLQVEHYQQESGLKHIKTLTAFPMLAGNGVNPPKDPAGNPLPVPVGPQAVLYAPPHVETGNHGEWKIIQPEPGCLKFLAEDVANTEAQLRELGRQPLTATAGITVVVAGLASQKASSAVQAWALGLKDALEQAYKITCMWLKLNEEPIVKVFTDFAIDPNDEKGPTFLMEMRKNGDLSRETLWEEAQRRNTLSADFDPEAENDRLEEERDEQIEDDDIAAARAIEIQKAKVPPNKPGAPPAPAA